MAERHPAYAELAVTTNFSFLRGGSHPEEIMARAAELGLAGIGIADRNSLAGVVRAHAAWRALQERTDGPSTARLRYAPGCRLVLCDGTPDLVVYPEDRAAYGRLTRLLTLGNAHAPKGLCRLTLSDVMAHAEGLHFIIMPASTLEADEKAEIEAHARKALPEPELGRSGRAEPPAPGRPALADLILQARGRVWLAVIAGFGPSPRRRMAERRRLAARLGLPLLAVGDVLMHVAGRKPLQDVLSCIRLGLGLDQAGRALEANAERHLKAPAEMARLFAAAPGAVAETQRFLAGLGFSLDQLSYDYPEEVREGFSDPQAALEHFTWAGARERYGEVPPGISDILRHELALIAGLNYAAYFLTVHDIVRFARSRGILCQGRGSAANSSVCFCLGITEVDPTRHDLLFERFISAERREPPDIDVDFEHERREEVIQYIYARYGRARAGLAASVITYGARSAVREVGKVFGLSADMVGALSGSIWGWSDAVVKAGEVRRLGLDPADTRIAHLLHLCTELSGFPRHLSQHVGGFVITRTRLDEVIPIQNAAMAGRTVVEWDKDDLDTLGILKIDVLALGMLSCLRGCFDLHEQHYKPAKRLILSTIPAEEEPVYCMIQRADTLGVFQIESRAQMSMLPRLKPAKFYDLVIEVAIVRPGPIQGDMVHPYLRRRQGLEQVNFPSPSPEHGRPDELERVLGKTLGVPLFQEQAMRIAIVAAGFTPGEADRLRRAMATFRRVGTIGTFATKMVEGMVRRGYDRDFAERCFRQIEGFGEYGFPESHAASFALLVYASCWFKCRYPDVFACALLNAQPMGFYAPSQIVRDAREHGVEMRPVDINHSCWDCTLEMPDSAARTVLHPSHRDMAADIIGTHALRLGFRQVKGLSRAELVRIEERRGAGYDSVRDLWLRTALSREAMERLAEADAFRSLGLSRRDAHWAVKGLRRSGDKDDLPLFAAASQPSLEADMNLPAMLPGHEVVEDYAHLSLSLKAHPVSFLRPRLAALGVMSHDRLLDVRNGARVTIAGLVLVRQRPGTAKGVIFMTLEDETGIANVLVWPSLFERFRPVILGGRLTAVTGRVQREAGVMHVVADRLEDFSGFLAEIAQAGPLAGSLARADEVKRPGHDARGPGGRGIGARRISFAKTLAIQFLLREEPALEADLAATQERDQARQVMPKGRNFH
ncbi:MAG: error-prone DNA polymerase [Hyphomicrobiales bacterium]|nr:error-prone DNA polymerase [Hyphomicrobiales bacterium]